MTVKNIKHGTNYRVISPYISNATKWTEDTNKPIYIREINEFTKFERI